MNTIFKLGLLLTMLSLLLFVACDEDEDLCPDGSMEPCTNLGTLNPESYVAIGNSLTSGFISSALYEDAQNNSYPSLLNTQINSASAGEFTNSFTQPLISYPGLPEGLLEWTGITDGGDPIITASSGTGTPINTDASTFRNLGVPGAYLSDVLNATGSSNSWLTQFGLPGNSMFDLIVQGQTQFQRAKALSPTFVTLWVGNNDIIGFAASGGLLPPTTPDAFAALYAVLADSIASLGADVVVVNIPDVTSTPFFTTIGPTLGADTTLPALYYYNSDTVAQIFDYDNDFLLLTTPTSLLGDTTGTGIPFGFHPLNPLPNSVVLDAGEAATTSAIIAGYNAAIASIATANGWGLLDINAFLGSAVGGIEKQGDTFSAAFITGQVFSFDGIHPTGKGHGLIANELIAVINTKFAASIEEVTLANLPANSIKATAKIAIGGLDGMLKTFGIEPEQYK